MNEIKIENHSKNKMAYQENKLFETRRKMFYRNLDNKLSKVHKNERETEGILKWWKQQWQTIKTCKSDYKNVLDFEQEVHIFEKIDIDSTLIYGYICNLDDWKAAGPDGIFNFFIKRLKSLHESLANCIKHGIENPESIPQWMFVGNTHLIPKVENPLESEYRPITCLSNLYKLLTKTVCFQLEMYCQGIGFILRTKRVIEGIL
jgi:hypothetical protein